MTARDIHPLHPMLGVEITGLDVTQRLDDEEVGFLRDTFDRHGLVLVRDVELDRTQQAYLCELLRGERIPTQQESVGLADKQDGFWISNKVDGAAAPFGSLMFHADSMWSEFPFDVISLYGVDVQPPAAPTLFASATMAWKALPENLQSAIRNLEAVNVSGPEYLPERRIRAFDDLIQGKRDHVPSYTWPVVRNHPRTGQSLLYICQANTQRLVGLDAEASEDLIEQLFEYLYASDNVLEYEWRNGDLVIWDNYSVQHGRPDVDNEGPARTLRKVALPVVESTIAESLIESYETVNTAP